MAKYDELECLRCIIEKCDEAHKDCFFRIWREAERPSKEILAERQRAWYANNADKKKQKVAEHQRANPEQHRKRQREYYARKKQTI